MQKTYTLGFCLTLGREITLVPDKQDVSRKAGDVVVQRGMIRAWLNDPASDARLCFPGTTKLKLDRFELYCLAQFDFTGRSP